MVSFELLEQHAKASGFFPLKPAQSHALKRLSRGESLLLVWPTGFGKSLCYQLPAVAAEDGLVVVISPLIALMDDQVAKGRQLGWPVTCVHSGLDRQERERRLRQVAEGQVRLLYVTPERFRQPEFVQLMRGLKVNLLAVDEAHCISQWGHDFRPDYSRVGEIRQLLGQPQTLALTATATREVQRDISTQLGQAEASILWEGVERPNLYLAAEEFEHEDEKLTATTTWLSATAGPKIVYCTLISTLVRVSEWLQGKGFAHDVYHGELPDGQRRRSLARFLSGESDLILATPAFGLGVDKPDVRGVLHFEVPGSLEAYFQEVGRAGRDGGPARCLLLYAQNDLETQMRFVETLTPDPSFVKATYELLDKWKDRLKTLELDDLREQLSFKNKRDYRLETALSFLDRWGVISYPQRKLARLEFVRPLTNEELTPELWAKRREQLQRKLLGVVQWFRSEECRKVTIYRYFGWAQAKPCGFCDRCDE